MVSPTVVCLITTGLPASPRQPKADGTHLYPTYEPTQRRRFRNGPPLYGSQYFRRGWHYRYALGVLGSTFVHVQVALETRRGSPVGQRLWVQHGALVWSLGGRGSVQVPTTYLPSPKQVHVKTAIQSTFDVKYVCQVWSCMFVILHSQFTRMLHSDEVGMFRVHLL